jgi:ribonuclease M5
MIKIEQAVIVEGKYDKIRLSSMLDAVIIETDGFGIFKDKEKQRLIRKLAEKRGILILTDSDSAGFKIRSFISGTVPPEKIFHAYIPDIFGKERRKDAPSKEGKLGVEGVPNQIIYDSLRQAGVTCSMTSSAEKRITKTDLYVDGIFGQKNSSKKRAALIKYLDLPEHLSTNALVQILNMFMNYDDYKADVKACGVIKGDRTVD